MQGVFHAVIGEDEGEFNSNEVLTHLCNKLVTRHTHIFGDVVANNADEALMAWEAAKAKEKSQSDLVSKIEGVAKALPSLQKAAKYHNFKLNYWKMKNTLRKSVWILKISLKLRIK